MLAASIAMICMLIIPKIIKYERAHNVHEKINRWVDINSGMKSALDAYQVDNGHYPKSLQELVQRADDATNWHGPYFDPAKLPVDPWGKKYIYEYPGKHNTNAYDLFSTGPDRKAGTADDIVNWTN